MPFFFSENVKRPSLNKLTKTQRNWSRLISTYVSELSASNNSLQYHWRNQH